MKFDFSNVSAEDTASNYIQQAGLYTASIKNEGIEFIQSSKTPYFTVPFETKYGVVNERFFISPKAMSRLQELHISLYGKALDKSFSTEEEVFGYFKVALRSNIPVGIKVILEKVGDKRYCKLSFKDFLTADLSKFEERIVSEADPDASLFITEREVQRPGFTETVGTQESVKVEASTSNSWDSVGAPQDEDDLPF